MSNTLKPAWVYACQSTLALVLLPLIIWQGRAVRRSVPILPEAKGPIEGVIGSSSDALGFLVLGDSTAAGVGARQHTDGLVGQTAVQMAQLSGQAVHWQVLGQSGLRAKDLPAKLLSATSLEPIDVVLVAVGVNDVLRWTSGRSWKGALTALQQSVNSHCGQCRVVYSGLPPMADFPALPFPLNRVLAWRAKYLDRLLADWCTNQQRCQYLNVPLSAKPSMLASDGFHPSESGYTAWGQTAAHVVLKHLDQDR